MSGTLRLLKIEFRRSAALLVAPLIVVLAWLWLHEAIDYIPLLWLSASLTVQKAVLVAGPIAAGTMAWMAGRDRRRGIEELLATTARPGIERRLTLWASAALWGLLAYGLFAAYVLGRTGLEASWGSPALWPLAIGLTAFLAQAAVGFAAGTLLPSRFTAPLVVVALYSGQLALTGQWFNGRWFGTLGPYWTSRDAPSSLFLEPTVNIDWARVLVYLGVAGAALAVVALRGGRGRSALGALALSAALVIGGAAAVWGETSFSFSPDHRTVYNGWGQPRPAMPQTIPFTPVCREAPLTVCLHPAFEPVLADATRTVNALAAPLLGASGMPMRAEQQFFRRTDDVLWVQFGTSRRQDGTFEVVLQPWNIANDLVVGLRDGPPSEAQVAIRTWLMAQAGFDTSMECHETRLAMPSYPGSTTVASCAATEHFATLPQDEQHQWLIAHYPALRAGELTLADLP